MAGLTMGTVNLSLLRRLAALGAGAIFKDRRDGNEEQFSGVCLPVTSFERDRPSATCFVIESA